MHCASRWFDHHGRLRFTIFCASKPIHCLPGSRHGPELQSCLPPVLFWTGNATAGIQFVAELRAKLWGAELKTKSTTMSMMSWAPAAPHTGKSGTIQTSSILFFPFYGPIPNPSQGSIRCGSCFPLGNALPTGASVACSLLRIGLVRWKLPCSAANLLYPSRVARISRFIGISDTTVNRCGWQVYFEGTWVTIPGKPTPNCAQAQKTPP